MGKTFSKLFLAFLLALLPALVPSVGLAQQQLLTDPEIYEKDHYRQECPGVLFGNDFIKRFDINNDGLIDAVVNHGAMTCNGKQGIGCTDEGCPNNFYLQVKEGGYFMIATAQIYGYDFVKRFGNMVFVFKMHPKYCNRTEKPDCEMTVRIRGAQMVTISKK